ncbi:MAG: serine hydrolase domain-containing protein [Pseudomonadota bacterium]
MTIRMYGAGTCVLLMVACTGSPGGDDVPDVPAPVSDHAATPLARDITALIDVFAPLDEGPQPGCAVGLSDGTRTVLAEGYGLANLEHDIPNGPDTVFRIASVSKQFTAYAVALLAEDGAIDVDADIRTYLPDLRPYEHEVTVAQMIAHTAAMPDYEVGGDYELFPGQLFRFGDMDYWSIEDFYDVVRTKPLGGVPGEAYAYSNTAYFLLGQLVERVSGQSLRNFAQERIFDPLGMDDTLFMDDVRLVLPNRATGYRPVEDEGRFEIAMTNLPWVGEGGVHTTVNDMLVWDSAFHNGTIPGGPAMAERLATPFHNMAGDETDAADTGYAYGRGITTMDGQPVELHSGGWTGHVAYYVRNADTGRAAVTLCNTENPPDGLTERMHAYVTAMEPGAD